MINDNIAVFQQKAKNIKELNLLILVSFNHFTSTVKYT